MAAIFRSSSPAPGDAAPGCVSTVVVMADLNSAFGQLVPGSHGK
jgi:hypothetical protein